MTDFELRGGRITVGGGEVDALAVRDGRVASPGTAGPHAVVVDLEGRRVVPGLIDSHVHMVRAGATWDDEIHWDELPSLADGLALLRRRAAQVGPGRWLAVVGGWHPCQFAEQRMPTRAELDAAAPDNPVYVQALYEQAQLSSLAVDAVGGPDRVDDLDGFNAVLAVALPAPDLERQVASTRSMLAELARLGLTGAIDAGGFAMGPDRYRALYEVWRRGQLTVRTRLYLCAQTRDGDAAETRDWLRFLQPGFGDEWLRVTGIGEIALYGCHDFEGLTPGFTIAHDTARELEAIARLCAERGWPMHLHAVLDTTITTILDVWERVDRDLPLAGRRWSLAHAEPISRLNLLRVAALGVGLAVQDRMVYRGAASAAAWGAAALPDAPPLREILDLGIPLGAGTDATRVTPVNPWRCLWWLVTGRSLDGAPPRATRHRLTRAEALHAYTVGSAWFSADDDVGTLEVGTRADLAVLSDDYFTVPDEQIPSLTSVLTLAGGRVTHAESAYAWFK